MKNLYSLILVGLAIAFTVLFSTLGLAQDVVTTAAATAVVPADTGACIGGLSATVIAILAGIVPFCSFLSNFVGKDTFVGKLINYVALNFTVKKTS